MHEAKGELHRRQHLPGIHVTDRRPQGLALPRREQGSEPVVNVHRFIEAARPVELDRRERRAKCRKGIEIKEYIKSIQKDTA